MSDKLRLFIPSPASRFHPQVVEYLRKSGLNISTFGKKLFFESDNFDIYFARGFDIPLIIESGWGDIGITGLDAVEEMQSHNLIVLRKLGIRYSRVVLASSRLSSKEELKSGDTIVSEYRYLTQQYLLREEIFGLKILHVTGAAEVYGYIPEVSAIITLATSGQSLIDNDQKILDIIFQTQACLICNMGSYGQKKEQLLAFVDQLPD